MKRASLAVSTRCCSCNPAPVTSHVPMHVLELSSMSTQTINKVVKRMCRNAPMSCRCAEACNANGIDFLDAPISGSPQRAKDGTLTIMCGGTQQAYDKVAPILRTMGSHVTLMGDHGAGTAAKLVCTSACNANALPAKCCQSSCAS